MCFVCYAFNIDSGILQAYDYLHQAHKKIIIFEDKYVGLRQRLDLAKQIKDVWVYGSGLWTFKV